MKRALATLALAVLAASTALSSASAAPPPPGGPPVVDARPAAGGRGPADGWHGPMRRDRADAPMRLAAALAAAETFIGIRSAQLDAWRDYTSALIDLAAPPPPPPPPADADAKAFAREEQMIREVTARAAKAAVLEKAIASLRASLTPEQLDRLGKLDLSIGPPGMGPGFGPGRGEGPGRPGPRRDGPPPHANDGGQDGPQGLILPDADRMMPPDLVAPAAPDTAPDGASEIPDNSHQPATAPRPG